MSFCRQSCSVVKALCFDHMLSAVDMELKFSPRAISGAINKIWIFKNPTDQTISSR